MRKQIFAWRTKVIVPMRNGYHSSVVKGGGRNIRGAEHEEARATFVANGMSRGILLTSPDWCCVSFTDIMHLGVTTGLFCKQNLNYRMWASRSVMKIAMDVFSALTFLKSSSALIGSAFWTGWVGIGWAIGGIQAAVMMQSMPTYGSSNCAYKTTPVATPRRIIPWAV